MLKKIETFAKNVIDTLTIICSELTKIKNQLQILNDTIDDLKTANAFVETKDTTQETIDKAFRLKNGLYSFKKVLIKDGE